MGPFIFGALAMLALVTFVPPTVAAWPSEKLRQLVAWAKEHMRPNPNGEG